MEKQKLPFLVNRILILVSIDNWIFTCKLRAMHETQILEKPNNERN